MRSNKGVEATSLIGYNTCLHRCRRARKPACAVQNDRTSPTSGRLLVDHRSNCRCSCTKDWYSARHASTSPPLVQPFSSSPSKSLLKSCRETTSSPPTTIAGQKQLKACPMTERAATVERTQFTKLLENDAHHDGFLLQIMATDFAQRSHHTGTNMKVFIIDCWESRMIRDNVLFPLFNKRQCGGFLDFLQQAIYESRQFSESVVTLICCSGGVNKFIGN